MNLVNDVTALISNKLVIYMIALFQEAQLKSNTIEEVILYINNLQPTALVSAGGKDVQVNPYYDLDDSKEDFSFLNLQINSAFYFLDQTIANATMNSLKLCLKLSQYLLSNDTKTVELVVSPTISMPKKDPFSFLRGGKIDNTVFTMPIENIINAPHPVREYQNEYYTSIDKNNNTDRTTEAITIKYHPP